MGFSDLLLGKKKLDSQQEKSHKAPEKVAEKSSLFGSIGRAIREKIHGIIPKKEIETVITKEASPALSLKQLRSFSPEFIVKTFVIDPKLKEQYLAELSYNIEHNGMEKAQIMLLYTLFHNSILPIREEEKEHLTQLFRGDSPVDQADHDGKDEILVGVGVMEVKKEQDKHSPITAPKPLDRDQLILKNTFMLQDTPMLSLQDTDKVPYIVAEYVTDKNDIGNFRKLLKNTPSDSLARATHLKNLLYGLRAAGIINLQEIDTKIPTLQKSIETVFTEHADISVSKHGDSAPEALDALSLLQKDFLQEDDKRYYALDIQEPFSMEIRKKFLQNVYSYLDSTQILNFKKEITELARSQGQSKQQQDILKDLDSRMKAKEDTRNVLATSISYLTEKLLITPDTDPAIIATIDGHIRTIKEYCMPVIDMEKAFPKELKSFTYEEVKELENNGTITLKNFSLPNEEK